MDHRSSKVPIHLGAVRAPRPRGRARGIALLSATVMMASAAPAIEAPAAASPLPSFLSAMPFPGLPSLPGTGPAPDAAQEGPAFTLSATEGLHDDSVLTVTGTGYAAGENVYVTQTIDKPASGYPETFGEAVKVTVGADGGFTAELPVDVVFGDVDCRSTQCFVATFTAFPKLADRSQDAWEPIHFAGGARPDSSPSSPSSPASPSSPSTPAASPANGATTRPVASGGTAASRSTGQGNGTATTSAHGPHVTLSTTEIAASGVTPITVTGTGFSTTGAGVYVGVAEKAKFSHTDASNFGSVNYVKASEMGADGSFTTIVDVEAVFAAGNCIDNACAMFTFAAHGSSDRSQDTVTDLSVAGTAAEKSAASAAAAGAKPGSKTVGSKSATGSGSGQPAGLGPRDGAEAGVSPAFADAALASASSPMATLSAGLVGAVVGAAILGAGMLLGRRTRRTDAAGSIGEE